MDQILSLNSQITDDDHSSECYKSGGKNGDHPSKICMSVILDVFNVLVSVPEQLCEDAQHRAKRPAAERSGSCAEVPLPDPD